MLHASPSGQRRPAGAEAAATPVERAKGQLGLARRWRAARLFLGSDARHLE